MAYEKEIIIIPLQFMKKTIQSNQNKKSLIDALKDYAGKNKLDLEFLKFSFIKESLRNNLFFKMDLDTRDSLLFDAIFLASLNENKNKVRPKTYADINDDRPDTLLISLQKELIKYLFRNLDNSSFEFNIILNKYLLFFNDLSCVKRKKNDV